MGHVLPQRALATFSTLEQSLIPEDRRSGQLTITPTHDSELAVRQQSKPLKPESLTGLVRLVEALPPCWFVGRAEKAKKGLGCCENALFLSLTHRGELPDCAGQEALGGDLDYPPVCALRRL